MSIFSEDGRRGSEEDVTSSCLQLISQKLQHEYYQKYESEYQKNLPEESTFFFGEWNWGEELEKQIVVRYCCFIKTDYFLTY